MDESLRALLLPLWIRYELQTHVPSENTYGMTCDELGCAYCNLSSEPEMLLDVMRELDKLPDDDELAEAVLELLEGEGILVR